MLSNKPSGSRSSSTRIQMSPNTFELMIPRQTDNFANAKIESAKKRTTTCTTFY